MNIKKPSIAFLYCVIVILIGALIAATIQTKAEIMVANQATKETKVAQGNADSTRSEFEKLFIRCDALERQCTAVKELRNRQEEALFTYIKKKYRTVSELVARETSKQTVKLSAELNAPFVVVVGIMEVESAFDPAVVSKAGARGLMQVMPKFWVKRFDYLSSGYDLHEIDIGIQAGIEVYLEYFNATKTISGALAKYFGAADTGYEVKVFKAISQFTFHMAERG